MQRDRQNYNLGAVQELLVEGFNAEELTGLCTFSGCPDLHPIPKEFAPGDGLTAMVRKTIEYCTRRDLLPELLAEVEQARPRLYERYASRLKGPAPSPGEEQITQPPDIAREEQATQPPDAAGEVRVQVPPAEQRPAPAGLRRPLPRHILRIVIPAVGAVVGALLGVLLLRLDLGLADFSCTLFGVPVAVGWLGLLAGLGVIAVVFPGPMSDSEIRKRYDKRALVEHAVRLVPKSEFSEDGCLGREERAYVLVGDYAEQRHRSLRDILQALWIGAAFDRIQSSNVEWVAIVFDMGELNRRKLDLMPATWKAVFRIFSDPKRLRLIDATEEEEADMGPEQDRGYYAGDQRWWYDRITIGRPGLEPGQAESVLEERLGISWSGYSGEGTTEGQVPSRLFLVRNAALRDLHSENWDLGSPDDGRILP